MKFWAYLHQSGNVHVKGYRGKVSDDAIDDAYESSFVIEVVEPFEAASRIDAANIAAELLSNRLSEGPIQYD